MSWPPTPSVEDEEAALANEYDLDSIASPAQSREEPQAKGTVDQYPIILDAYPQTTSRNNASAVESDRDHSSSDESHGPPTPTTSNSEQRFVLLEHEAPGKTSPQADWQPPRSEDPLRGRPYVSPIKTNVGNDLDEMVTGRRRLTSPYALGPKQLSSGSLPQKRFSGESFLSPQLASSDEYYRARSTGRRGKHEEARSLTDPEKSSEKRKHHSRRRRESGVRSARPSPEDLAPASLDKRSVSYVATAAPVASMLSLGIQKQSKDDSTVADAAKHKRASRDSPYTSAAEEKTRRHRSKSRRRSKSRPRMGKIITQTSPYTSSAEESKHTNHRFHKISATERKLSRRSSTIKPEQPRLDISDQYYSYGVGYHLIDRPESSKCQSDSHHPPVFDGRSHPGPSSAQSPKAMEDYLVKAFKANSKRSDRIPTASPNASPFATPPRSPPRTPRRDRGSKDYFDHSSGTVQDIPRSRQASGDDSPWNILRPPTKATAAPELNSSRTIPTLSRSSTAPIDAPSQSSSSKAPSNGPRSRRPSPVHEDFIRPVSRAGSMDIRDDRPLSRLATSASSEQRRRPRLPTVITQAPLSMDDAATPRTGHTGLEAPRSIIRSYSTVPEEMTRPPPAHRTMSTSQVLPSSATEHWRPSPVYRSSSSAYITPTSGSSSNVLPFSTPRPVQGPPAPPPVREPAPTNLPPCPRSTPVAGYHDWYTVSSVSEMNICPTCMAILGSSRFRDIFVPSFFHSNREIRCAMSLPWLRIAFIQAVKQRRSPQEMIALLQALLHLPNDTRPCAGKEPSTRKWYQLIDPFDNTIVPGFEICTHCVRNVDLVFPSLRSTFARTTSLLQERVCNLNTQSKRFLGYIEQLDKASTRYTSDTSRRKPDIQDLAKHARRVANIHDCQKDNMLFNTEWHFMTRLPEFTVCSECFEEVIRPVWDRPLANAFPKKARLLPLSQEQRYVPAGATSCQLYSARMRKVFLKAVRNNDFEALKTAAVKRHDAEVRCQARHRELTQVQEGNAGNGSERAAEIRRNLSAWNSWA